MPLDIQLPWQRPVQGDYIPYGITPLGATKAEKYTAEGPVLQVLSKLKDDSPCTIAELSKSCGISRAKVRLVMRELVPHYAQRIVGAGRGVE